MNFLIVVLVFCFLFFLYILYILSREDFVILRNDISIEKIFSSVFIAALVSLFVSRIFYVLFHPIEVFHTFLGFLLFPYFPGLSLTGGVVGLFGFAFLYLRGKKMPKGRILDFYSVAFLSSLPIGFVGWFLLLHQKLSPPIYFAFILFCILVFIFVKFVLPLSLGGKIKDGSLTLLFLISFSIFYFISQILLSNGLSIFSLENLILLPIFILSLLYLVRLEELNRFFKR